VEKNVPFYRPELGESEVQEVVATLRSGWLTTGPRVKRFEQEFAAAVSARHAVAVNSCTAALHLAVEALGLRAGQGVLVPTMTFAATAEIVRYQGAVPVLVDCERDTLNMDLDDAARKLAALRAGRPVAGLPSGIEVVGILPVHVGGLMMSVDGVKAFAARHGLWVVEDAAHAFPAAWRRSPTEPWQQCGQQTSAISCFSFYANKIVTTGEGGMCVTDSPELATSLRVLRDHGMSPDRSYWHERVGFNYRITNLQAAIGQSQIWRVNEVLQRNARIAALYREALKGIADVRFPPQLPDEYRPVVWMTCVQVPAEKRLPLMRAAHEAQIETRPFFHPLSALPPYGKYARACPNSIELSATGVNLPTSHSVDEKVVERVARVFHDVFA
jgi:perosamine synthetase